MADELALSPAPELRVIWDRAALAGLAEAEGERPRTWRLDGSLAPAFSTLRVLSGATGAGALLVLCAARPAAADHHAQEAVAASVTMPGGDAEEIAEALLSTEYAADGSVRRVGLELYKAGDDYPLRAAGDAVRTTLAEDGAGDQQTTLELRLDGSPGLAHYEIVRAR